MCVVSVLHCLGHHLPDVAALLPCECNAGVAVEASHAVVCEKAAKLTKVRHETLAKPLRLVVHACTCRSVAKSHYQDMGGVEGMLTSQGRGEIVVVLPRLGSIVRQLFPW